MAGKGRWRGGAAATAGPVARVPGRACAPADGVVGTPSICAPSFPRKTRTFSDRLSEFVLVAMTTVRFERVYALTRMPESLEDASTRRSPGRTYFESCPIK